MMGFVPKEDGFVPVSKIEFRKCSKKKNIEFRCAEFFFSEKKYRRVLWVPVIV